MIAFLKRLWSAAPIATMILALALAASLFFSMRMVSFWIYWHDPAHRELKIEAWMTPGYIGNSWRVPKKVILDALDAPDQPPPGVRNLTTLAAYKGISIEELIANAEEAIKEYRAKHPPPGKQRP